MPFSGIGKLSAFSILPSVLLEAVKSCSTLPCLMQPFLSVLPCQVHRSHFVSVYAYRHLHE